MYKLLYRILPVNSFRAFLVDKHLSSCRACSGELAEDVVIEKKIVTSENINPGMDLWPGIKDGILALEGAQRRQPERVSLSTFFFGRKWQFGLAAALLVLALLVPILLYRGSDVADPETAGIVNSEIVVKSIRIENRPAKTFYFQSEDADKVIVWVKPRGTGNP